MLQQIVTEYFELLCGVNNKKTNGKSGNTGGKAKDTSPVITVCFMHEGGEKKPVQGYACVHCRVSELMGLWKTVSSQNGSVPPSLHVTVCNTNLKGRRSENIVGPRVLVLDLDREVGAEGLADLQADFGTARPQWIVESSPGKYHLYWLLERSCPLEVWSELQLGLAQHCRGDYNLANKTALIRVPGFVRICKDGRKFLPHFVMTEGATGRRTSGSTGGQIRPYKVAQLQQAWGWLGEACKAGKNEALEARRKASALGRELHATLKAANEGSGDGLLKIKDLSTVKVGQRNSTLYTIIRSMVYEFGAQEDSKAYLKQAEEINARFSEPLGQVEVASILKSAIERGLASRKRTEEKREKQISVLKAANANVDDSDQVQLNESEEKLEEVNESKDLPSTNLYTGCSAQVNKIYEEVIPPARREMPDVYIPASIAAAGKEWADRILSDRELLTQGIQLLAACMATSNYELFAQWVCNKFRLVGCYRLGAPVVFIRDLNDAGQGVRNPTGLCSEQWEWLTCSLLSAMTLAAVQDSELKAIMPRCIKSASASKIASLSWAGAICEPSQERQAADRVVFQDGVLELHGDGRGDKATSGDTGDASWWRFTPDSAAAIKNSNAIWMYWDKEVEALFQQCTEKDWIGPFDLESLVKQVCPVFYRYCQDWFPGDFPTVRMLLRFFGYAMTTDFSRMKFLYFYGPTRSGKGSLCRVLRGLVGYRNYSSSDYSALEEGFRLANMRDKLVVSLEEAESGWKETERRMARLKKLTGGDRVTFERKYHDPQEDFLVGKIIMQANEAPHYQDKGGSIASRMLAVGFEHSFCEADKQPSDEILRVEGGRLATLCALCWAQVRGAKECFRDTESRAQTVGRTEVLEGLDIVGMVVERYLKNANADEFVSSQAITELVKFVAACKGVELGDTSKRIGIAIKNNFSKADNVKHVPGFHKRRGFSGLKFNKDAVLESYPELFEENALEAPTLISEMG